MIVFDIDTNGFLAVMDRVHVLVMQHTNAPGASVYRGADIPAGLAVLQKATEEGIKIVGHNVIGFDVPAIQKIYPTFAPVMAHVWDTMVFTCLIWPDTYDIDVKLTKEGKLPGNMRGRHSLEAWGYRIGTFKGEYEGDPAIADEKDRKARKWEAWNQTMEDYCVQDVVTTMALLQRCLRAVEQKGFSTESIELEHAVKVVVSRQERYGFAFNEEAARALSATLLKEKLVLEADLVSQFGSFYTSLGTVVTKRSARYQCEELGIAGYTKAGTARYRTMDFTAGCHYTKLQHQQFNPGSRDHVANRLKHMFEWEPEEFTADGKAKVDEQVLSQLNYPGIDPLKRLFMVNKRLGQIAEGKEAWLKHVTNGRIYGRVHTNKAVTGRMAHSNPNLGQVPASYSPFGKECRSCFIATLGRILVGADADALELRDLAGYMARYDGGAYVKTILEGKKEDGTDMHSVNCRALGMDPKAIYFDGETGRDIAKTWFLWKPKGTLQSNLQTINCVNSGNSQNGQS